MEDKKERFNHQAAEAILQGKKIEAIKIIREEKNIGLKEAKEMVDDYIAENNIQPPESTGGIGSLIVFAIIVGGGYFLYKYFSGS